MSTDIATHDSIRMIVWMGLLMSLLNAGNLSPAVHRLSLPALLVLLAVVLLSAIRRRLVTTFTELMTFPVF
jgi:hypothetical protein